MSGKIFLGFSLVSLLAGIAIYFFLMGREEGPIDQAIKIKPKIDLADCIVEYQNVGSAGCIEGMGTDDFTEKSLYPTSATIIKNSSESVRKSSVAFYSSSSSTCKDTWEIKENGEWREVNLNDFCDFIIDYNANCDDCLIKWEG